MDKPDKAKGSKRATRQVPNQPVTQDVTTSTPAGADPGSRQRQRAPMPQLTPTPTGPVRRRLSSLLGLPATSTDSPDQQAVHKQPPPPHPTSGRTLRRLSSLIGSHDAPPPPQVDAQPQTADLHGQVPASSKISSKTKPPTSLAKTEETKPSTRPTATTRLPLSSLFGQPDDKPAEMKPIEEAKPTATTRLPLSSLFGQPDDKPAEKKPTDETKPTASSRQPLSSLFGPPGEPMSTEKPRRRLSSLLGPGDPFVPPGLERVSSIDLSGAIDHNKLSERPSLVHIKAPSRSLLAAFQTEQAAEMTSLQFSNEVHRLLYKYVESSSIKYFCLFIILMHTTVMSFETFYTVEVRSGWYFSIFEFTVLGIYMMETSLKLYVYGYDFFYIGWNVVDGIIVIVNILHFTLLLVAQNMVASTVVSIVYVHELFEKFRCVKALNALRIIRFLSNLQVVVGTILQSLRSIGYIVMLMTLIMYMFAVIGRHLYASVLDHYFGSLASAFFTLFQMLTLDDWFDIYRQVNVLDPSKGHIILYLMLYIVVAYFVFLNLFVAVLVDNFQLTIENRNREKARLMSEQRTGMKTPGLTSSEVSSFQHQIGSKKSSYSDNTKEDKRRRKTIGDLFPGLSRTALRDLEHYFMLLAATEYNYYLLDKEKRVLEMMVNITAESDDTF